MPRIAIAAGHHNTSGGNPVEYAIVGDLTEVYVREFVRRGWDVRCITPDGRDEDNTPGDGNFPGDLVAAAGTVTKWASEGWVADLYFEVHTQGGPKVPGCFVIYPDWGLDVDTDVRDKLGPAISKAIAAAAPIAIYGNGVMSEKRTGVGLQGFRLGVFFATQGVKATTTRMIIEHGAHDVPAELEVLMSPVYHEKIAKAVANEIARFYGLEAEVVRSRHFPETNQTVRDPFWFFWETNGGLPIFGYPITPELSENSQLVQYFERARFELSRQVPGNVALGRVGAELLSAREELQRRE